VGSSFAAALNDIRAIIFNAQSQHREMKAPGISYELDDSGNALAAMLAGFGEIRFTAGFR
jgi:hypothetical protein